MAVRLLSHELSDLCLGKPALRSLSLTSTIAEALQVLKTSDDNFLSVWSCDHKPRTSPGFEKASGFDDDEDDECRCVGKICIVDVICFLCRDENLVSPSVALKQPVSALLPKIPGLVLHVEPSCSLLEAIDLIHEGAQNLVVPIKTKLSNKRSKQQQKPSLTVTNHKGREFCWLTQEDVIRFLLSSIGLFSSIPALSIDTLNIISPDTLAVEYHSPASAAVGAISRALVEQTSVAVVDSEGTLIGEISPFTLACCGETVAAAVKTLSSGDLMAYIDCGGPPEELVKVVSGKLKEKNLMGMLQHFTVSMSSGGFSSASSSSDEEYSMSAPVSPLPRPGRLSRSMSYSARMVRRSEAIVCHPKSSLVAVMIQAIAHRVNYVWVIEDDCSLVGIVTFSDMLKVFRENFETMA
ncbi:CBS domain-containing protein CBSX5 [Hibiscus syriacus]|uniref:CBS domain-containing protein CBSX5 n=1 Tax=Hibiscus syriacus TaxID=106335 RepID=A0A6A3BC52_HIBSY|nr:CBS domain-containing protein CBSX5-like [Hibiscus syriacus]KAE8713647.1 CBS domain-containing protein CBSX5 [Hibiscus syriacus]